MCECIALRAWAWSWRELVIEHDPMAFLKKKRVKFSVDFEVNRLTDVPLLNATLFAKVRLLDGGSFESFTNRGQVDSHTVLLGPKFNFLVRIPADAQTGQLEDCKCKVSIRKEDRGGRTTTKVGFVVINLSEFAASGVNEIRQSYLLDGYTGRQRQDNSRVHIHVRMIHQGADPMFKVPNMAITSTEEAQLNPVNRKAPSRTAPPAATLDESVQTALSESPATVRVQSSTPTPIAAQATTSMERASWHGGVSAIDSVSIASSNAFSNSSNAGTVSSGYGSLPGSSGSPQPSVVERASLPPSVASGKHAMRRMSDDRLSASVNRVQRTRHDPQYVIDEVIAETSLNDQSRTSTAEDEEDDGKHGLALFVGKDGEAVIGQNSMYSPTSLQRIHIGDASINGL